MSAEHTHKHTETPVHDEIEHVHAHDQAEEHTHDHPHSHTHTHAHTKAVTNRIARATGHLSAIKTMVENGRDCSEVLIQLAAVRSAINGICDLILQDHIDHCIVDAVKTGDMEALDELNKAIKLLMK